MGRIAGRIGKIAPPVLLALILSLLIYNLVALPGVDELTGRLDKEPLELRLPNVVQPMIEEFSAPMKALVLHGRPAMPQVLAELEKPRDGKYYSLVAVAMRIGPAESVPLRHRVAFELYLVREYVARAHPANIGRRQVTERLAGMGDEAALLILQEIDRPATRGSTKYRSALFGVYILASEARGEKTYLKYLDDPVLFRSSAFALGLFKNFDAAGELMQFLEGERDVASWGRSAKAYTRTVAASALLRMWDFYFDNLEHQRVHSLHFHRLSLDEREKWTGMIELYYAYTLGEDELGLRLHAVLAPECLYRCRAGAELFKLPLDQLVRGIIKALPKAPVEIKPSLYSLLVRLTGLSCETDGAWISWLSGTSDGSGWSHEAVQIRRLENPAARLDAIGLLSEIGREDSRRALEMLLGRLGEKERLLRSNVEGAIKSIDARLNKK